MNLEFTRSAQRDLSRLREFIAAKNPPAARRISQRLRQAIQRLQTHPEMGVMVDDLSEVYDLVSGDYIVRYTLLNDSIYILRIWHTKEDR